jgi:hypothetical protein
MSKVLRNLGSDYLPRKSIDIVMNGGPFEDNSSDWSTHLLSISRMNYRKSSDIH